MLNSARRHCTSPRRGRRVEWSDQRPGIERLHFRPRLFCRRCASDASQESVGAGSIDVTTTDKSLRTDSVKRCEGGRPPILPHSVSATGRTRRGELIAPCSLLGPAVPEPRVVLQSISLQPTQKVQEVRSDSLRSGNIAVLILVHAGGRLPTGSGTAFALPYSP